MFRDAVVAPTQALRGLGLATNYVEHMGDPVRDRLQAQRRAWEHELRRSFDEALVQQEPVAGLDVERFVFVPGGLGLVGHLRARFRQTAMASGTQGVPGLVIDHDVSRAVTTPPALTRGLAPVWKSGRGLPLARAPGDPQRLGGTPRAATARPMMGSSGAMP